MPVPLPVPSGLAFLVQSLFRRQAVPGMGATALSLPRCGIWTEGDPEYGPLG